MWRRCLFLYIISVTSCFGAVLDHLKTIDSPKQSTTIRNIDFIYLINLDHRPEKWKKSFDQLRLYGIIPYRFPAIYGWDLPLEVIQDVGVVYDEGMDSGFVSSYYLDACKPLYEPICVFGRTYFAKFLSPGGIGICLSHLSVLMDAYLSGYKRIWVMEDDIKVLQNPHCISALIEELNATVGEDQWDILFTDRNLKDAQGRNVINRGYGRRPNFKIKTGSLWNAPEVTVNQKVSSNLRKLGARFGATSMILTRSGIKKILDFYREYNIYFPFDMDYYAPDGMRIYTVLKDVITNQSDALSDNEIYIFEKS